MQSESFLKKASDIASFYGFRHARGLSTLVPRDKKFSVADSKNFEKVAQACVDCLSVRPIETTPPTPVYPKDAMLFYHVNPQPAMPYMRVPSTSPTLARDLAEFSVEIVGSAGSIGEIVSLKTIFAILNDANIGVRGVRIGSAGDKDSQARFARELSLYVKKRHADLGECCRERAHHDPFMLFTCTHEGCGGVLSEGPRAMNYLSEKSRTHFKEVLEYLERAGIGYELDERLVYDEHMPRVLFSVDLENSDGLVVAATGGRYDDHLRRITGKKDVTAVRASIFFRRNGASRSALSMDPKERRAKIYFVKLGIEAALKSLTVLDGLRKARIPVYQSFSSDRLAPQLTEAERLKVPYLVIMGQREALQDAVIVRRVATRSQQIVRIKELPNYLRAV